MSVTVKWLSTTAALLFVAGTLLVVGSSVFHIGGAHAACAIGFLAMLWGVVFVLGIENIERGEGEEPHFEQGDRVADSCNRAREGVITAVRYVVAWDSQVPPATSECDEADLEPVPND